MCIIPFINDGNCTSEPEREERTRGSEKKNEREGRGREGMEGRRDAGRDGKGEAGRENRKVNMRESITKLQALLEY